MLKYTEEWKWSEEDFSESGRLKSSSLMYAFQEIAAAHATKLGYGFENMIADNNIWVMTKLRFKIYEQVVSDRAYRLETYPRPQKGITFFRDYYLYNGDILAAAAASHWCIINFETRKIERAKVNFDGEFTEKQPFERGIEKIKADELKPAGSYLVREEDIDVNRHVNNCRYADIIDGTADIFYDDFNIHFAREAKLGDEIKLWIEKGEKSETVIGKLDDETVIFQARISV